jgi:hypothetical protein
MKKLKEEVKNLFSDNSIEIVDDFDRITFTVSTKEYDLKIYEDEIGIYLHKKDPQLIFEIIKKIKEMI